MRVDTFAGGGRCALRVWCMALLAMNSSPGSGMRCHILILKTSEAVVQVRHMASKEVFPLATQARLPALFAPTTLVDAVPFTPNADAGAACNGPRG